MGDEISQGSEHDFRLPWSPRLPPGRWRVLLAVAALAGAAVAGTLVLSSPGGRPAPLAHPSQRPNVQPAQVPGPAYTSSVTITITATSVATPRSVPPAAATMLLPCGAANYSPLDADWRRQSLRVGPLSFFDSKLTGYVRLGRSADTGVALPGQAPLSTTATMILEVDPNAAIVLQPAPGTDRYFRFVDGFGPGTSVPLPVGDTGFTVVGCPAGAVSGSAPTSFYLGFTITPGMKVPVEVRTSPSADPVWVTFMVPS